ncbi:putative aminoglycoside 3'-phosphotransferase (Kanamycin kinase) [Lactococcus cremoris]|nr:phosphotransferase [Lactococcus cremoris]KZK04806.1 putative aminoglycoside 3'-phosphotransferase (Kanamycin kinase) [Lactococcus cremoris]KZK34337.1 putative aminoglycoside 3'-phosphotransferase (Kanamycin kinase) [Lactococcus cremoris]KZK48615.1 putative aminoglycoside 3'-phosphotransferase (Kanamycin kinase) [Lactococcus cremoris]
MFIDKKDGYYLKIASKKSLEREAEMTDYFKKKNLGLGYISYLSDQSQDFLLKEKIQGDNYLAKQYLKNPKQLCDSLAENLRFLHEQNFEDCPILDHSERYLKKVENNARLKKSNLDFVTNYNIHTPEEAYDYIQNNKLLLKDDTLLHGDYCLPNIILDNWQFKGFIDLDCAGCW